MQQHVVDSEHLELCRLSIGGAAWLPFAGLFGDPHFSLPGEKARVIQFPAVR